MTDAVVAKIAKSPKLEHLEIGGCPDVTRACVAALSRMDRLRVLSLKASAWVDDSTLEELSRLTNLRELAVGSFGGSYWIAGTRRRAGGPNEVTSAGVAHLAKLRNLRVLDLASTQPLTAASLRGLRHLKLTRLDLNHTDIRYDDETASLHELRAIWPEAEVPWWPPLSFGR